MRNHLFSRSTLTRRAFGAIGTLVGPLALAMQRRRNAAVVLLYHRVSPEVDAAYPPLSPAEFSAHCEFIHTHYRVLKLSTLIERVRDRAELAGCCAITFDDGYRDFLDHAYPVLTKFGFPSTHFLIANCVRNGHPPWTYRRNRLATCSATRLRLHAMTTRLQTMATGERDQWLEEMERELPRLSPRPRMLRESDLSLFDANLIDWGSHTLSHSFLPHLDTKDVVFELSESKRQLETLTGRPIRYLAYPNGLYTHTVAGTARAAGYEAAMAVDQQELSSASSPFYLPRFDLTCHSREALPLEVTGVVQYMRRRLSRSSPDGPTA